MTSCLIWGLKPGLPGESGVCDPPLKPNLHVVLCSGMDGFTLELVHYLLPVDETQIPRRNTSSKNEASQPIILPQWPTVVLQLEKYPANSIFPHGQVCKTGHDT